MRRRYSLIDGAPFASSPSYEAERLESSLTHFGHLAPRASSGHAQMGSLEGLEKTPEVRFLTFYKNPFTFMEPIIF